MARALVLGGGGPVGIGWEAGLILGLADAGVDLAPADLILGTSAGSVVGAQLAAGQDMTDTAGLIGGATAGQADMSTSAEAMQSVMAALNDPGTEKASPEAVRRQLGRIAAAAVTMPEDAWVGSFAHLAGVAWPEAFVCTAVDIDDGAFRVWDAKSGIDLQVGVASSCSVPGIFPPVTIQGRRYMDGGMRTALNADLAVGRDTVIAVSCLPLRLPEGLSDPLFDQFVGQVDDELAQIRQAGGRVEVVEPGPEFLEVSGMGLSLMDFSRVGQAVEAGLHQAVAEADRLGAIWNS